MNLYLDTSALVPLVIAEPGTATCRSLWGRAELVLSCALARVEATAAFARAARHGRLTTAQHASALRSLGDIWERIADVPADGARLDGAAAYATRHALRGYDAVHCASAVFLADDDLVAASGDQELLAAWRLEGLTVVGTTR